MNSNSKTKFEFKQRRRKEKQKKKRREEASLWPRLARLRGPTSPTTPASQPNRPANPFPSSQRTRAQPTSRPSTPHTPTRSFDSPNVAAIGPHASASPSAQCHLPRTHASTAARSEADSAGRSGPGGHARDMALFPLRCAHTTSCHRRMHPTPFHHTMPSAIGAWSSAIKDRPRLP